MFHKLHCIIPEPVKMHLLPKPLLFNQFFYLLLKRAAANKMQTGAGLFLLYSFKDLYEACMVLFICKPTYMHQYRPRCVLQRARFATVFQTFFLYPDWHCCYTLFELREQLCKIGCRGFA